MGETPPTTKYPALNADPVVPGSFPNWVEDMNRWGKLMLRAVDDTSQIVAMGFGLPQKTFSDLSKYGPHLLAPTGSNLEKLNTVGSVLAGFHTDMNLLTIHGKSRFPGLSIWTPSGKKLLVKIPDGCLLVQAGKQMEILTGGRVLAGYHEVAVVNSTIDALVRQKNSCRPPWRVSSTLFFHTASDNILEPLGCFKTDQSVKDFPTITAGNQVKSELEFLALA